MSWINHTISGDKCDYAFFVGDFGASVLQRWKAWSMVNATSHDFTSTQAARLCSTRIAQMCQIATSKILPDMVQITCYKKDCTNPL